MKGERLIPYYAPDGTSLGFRTPDAAKRLIEGGRVKASWGRKGHLRAIWLMSPDGGNPIQTRAPQGTRYSFRENLDHGRCWKLRKLMAATRVASSSPLATGSCRLWPIAC
jgi:hypothetical protein